MDCSLDFLPCGYRRGGKVGGSMGDWEGLMGVYLMWTNENVCTYEVMKTIKQLELGPALSLLTALFPFHKKFVSVCVCFSLFISTDFTSETLQVHPVLRQEIYLHQFGPNVCFLDLRTACVDAQEAGWELRDRLPLNGASWTPKHGKCEFLTPYFVFRARRPLFPYSYVCKIPTLGKDDIFLSKTFF